MFTAREAIRRRRRRRWLLFLGGDTPEVEATWADAELREAARCVYRVFAEKGIRFARGMLTLQTVPPRSDTVFDLGTAIPPGAEPAPAGEVAAMAATRPTRVA